MRNDTPRAAIRAEFRFPALTEMAGDFDDGYPPVGVPAPSGLIGGAPLPGPARS